MKTRIKQKWAGETKKIQIEYNNLNDEYNNNTITNIPGSIKQFSWNQYSSETNFHGSRISG